MKVKALSPALGAEVIGIDLSVPLDDVMIDDLRALGIFAETIKQGSFKAAANVLNLSRGG